VNPISRRRDFLNASPVAATGPRLRRTRQRQAARRSCRLGVEQLEDRSLLATITVTGAGDTIAVDGLVTLREAITSANNNADVNADVVAVGTYGTDTINFNIPGAGVHTFTPLTQLPTITGPVTIDGYTQPGASPNTNTMDDPDPTKRGFNGTLQIELDGSVLASGISGGTGVVLGDAADGSTIRGLVIDRFPSFGILIQARDVTVAGCFIGVDPTGTTARGNGSGIFFDFHQDTANDLVGGTTPAARNLISGNNTGIFIQSGPQVVQGNLIGTDATGLVGIPNSIGVMIQGISNNLIGGSTAAARNVINASASGVVVSASGNQIQANFIQVLIDGVTPGASANTGIALDGGSSGTQIGGPTSTPGTGPGNVIAAGTLGGIQIGIGSNHNVIQGNLIGTDATGTQALGIGLEGIQVAGAFNTIGGPSADARNVISAGGQRGISLTTISTGSSHDNLIQNNFIGTDIHGNLNSLGNGDGVFVNVSSDNRILDNIIAGNAGRGVSISSGTNTAIRGNFITGNAAAGVAVNTGATGSAILGNSIFANGGLGIDLGNTGVTENDPTPNLPCPPSQEDCDTGPNNLQNFPELTVAGVVGGTVTVEYAVPSATVSSAYPLRIEFFKADADGQEGRTLLGFDTYTAAESTLIKSVSFPTLAAVAVGDRIVATATDAANNTSEFSAAQSVGLGIDLAAGTVTIPAAAALGGNIAIDYVVHNLGSAPEDGNWIDSLYLSTDGLLDASDPLIGRVEHVGQVGAHASYGGTLSARLPGVNEGDYRVLVLADSRRLTPDTNRVNNLAASTGSLHVTAPLLPLGGTVSGTIADGQDLYFRLDVPPASDVALAANFSVSSQAEMYVSYGVVPSPFNFDQRVTNLSDLRPSLALSGPAGSYFILLHGREAAGSGARFDLADQLAGFEVTSLSPNHGSNAGQATVTLLGSGFTSHTVVSLTRADGTRRDAARVVLRDGNSLFATFDLQGLTAGTYDVHLEDGVRSATVAGAFTVTSGVAGHLETGITSTSPIRPFQEGTLTVDYVNAGDTDVPAPLLTVVADNARLRFPDQQSYLGESVQVLGINRDGPAGVLPPGARGRITLAFLPETFGAHIRSNFTLAVAGPAETPHDIGAVKESVRPPGIPADAWDAVFANLIAKAGITVGQYQALLDDNATALSLLGQYTPEISRLLAMSIQEADNAYPGLTLATSRDALAPAPGAVPLLLQRTYLQAISSRYRIGAFGRGWAQTWESSAAVDSDGNVLVQTPGGFRFFRRQSDGSFLGSFGDPATLTQAADGSHTLVEKEGTRFTFRPDGKLSQVADTNGNQIALNYTGGQLTELVHSDGDRFTLAYEQHGRVRQLADQAGRVTTYNYDSSGEHLLSVIGPAGTTAYSYASGAGAAREHALESVTNPDGSHRFYAYDAQGRLVQSQRDGGAERVQYSYGGSGEVTTTDGLGGGVTLRFNDAGQPAQVVDALGRIAQFRYDALNHLVRGSQPQGGAFLQQFDSRGNLLAQVDPLGERLEQSFDPALSQLLRIRDAQGFVTDYGRDARGNLTTLRYADGSVESYTVDASGNVVQFQNRRGQSIFNHYDARGELLRVDHGDGSHEDFTYDDRGNLLTATGAHGTTQFSYDGADRLTRVADPSGRILDYAYDAGGRRIRLVDQTGFAVNYSYDAAGRLSALTADGGAAIVSYAYDAAGRLARADKGNGTFTTYGYDAAGQLLHLVNRAPDGSVHSRFDYAYDDLGRPTSMTTLAGTTTYGYDLVGRLTAVGLPGGRTIQFAYDAAGNRISMTDAGTITAYTTNSLQEYTQVGSAARTYDADGNLLRETSGGQLSTFAYDDQNRLTTVVTPAGTWSYEYDALGNRIATIGNGQRTEYLLDPTGLVNVAGVYDAAGSLLARYVHSNFGLVSQLNAGGAADYYDFDSIGSTAGLTAADGSVLNSYSYLPFGETLSATENVANPFTYVGALGVMAEENGLTFMRNRFYQADVGAFTSIDPLRLLAHGLYQYANNNPAQLVDPQGLDFMGSIDLHLTPPSGNSCVDDQGDAIPGCDPHHPPPPKPIPPPSASCIAINGVAGELIGPVMRDGEVINPCNPPTPPKPPPVPVKPGGNSSSEQQTPKDPNDITGPSGFGQSGFLAPGLTLPYRINFENEPDASVPAQVVVITQQLDPDLDFSTFEVGDFGFGAFTIDVPSGLSFFSTRVDARSSVGVFVNVTAGIDPATGIATWTFTSLDPDTLDLLSDPLGGFLPPNVTAPEGDGFVSYFIRSRSGLPTGARLDAQARIVFDTEDPVDTPAIFNTIDVGPPTSSVDPLAAVIPTENFPLSWSASDDADGSAGSGISLFDVFVSVDGGAFTPFMLGTPATSATFNGQFGHGYGFFSVATDNVGHRQPTPAGAQAVTQLVSGQTNSAPKIFSLVSSASECGKTAERQIVTVTASFTDANAADVHRAAIDWGDGSTTSGTVSESNGSGTVLGGHSYAGAGVYTIVLTLDDGTASASATALAYITGVALHKGELQIVGTAGDDRVVVTPRGAPQLKVEASFLPGTHFKTFRIADVDRIRMILCAGNDDARLAASIKTPVTMEGGAGNDYLQGGRGNDTLLGGEGSDRLNGQGGHDLLFGGTSADHLDGGDGNDIIIGGDGNDVLLGMTGRDLLIGGNGADQLSGGADDDILIAGSTVHDEDEKALLAILAEWTSSRSYTKRVNNIRYGGGANGAFTLDNAEVIDDGLIDLLNGDAGLNWLLMGVGDATSGKKSLPAGGQHN
jgi:RHS repeat-associated protein